MRFRTIIFLALFSLISSQAHAGLKISCSMFPVYDFARAVAGDNAKVNLILKPGVEPHEYEPSPLDIKTLNDSDVFIFTSKSMEHWAEKISETLTNTNIIDASNGITLFENDPHIWLDLDLAQRMIWNISLGLSKIDPDNSQIYSHNANEYCAKLDELDKKFAALNHDKAIVFAGEFSYGYFIRHYDFDYVSAYEGENEPGIKRLTETVKHINTNKTKYIFADSGPLSRITLSIVEQTGAFLLIFNTAHNVQDISQTFLQIMTDNYTNLARALND